MLLGNINNTMLFSFISVIYMVFFAVNFFIKKKIKSVELTIFKGLIIANLASLLVEILLVILIMLDSSLLDLMLKIYNVCLFSYVWIFGLYSYSTLRKSKKISFKSKIGIFYFLFYIIGSILMLIVPVYLNNVAFEQYSYGPSVSLLFMCIGLIVTVTVYTLLKNIKNVKRIKCTPIIAFILFIGLTAIIQFIWPHVLLANSFFSFVTFMMYFIIENPDVKVIHELNKNKDILEKNNEDHSNFMFRMTQEVRKPISNIDSLTNMIDISNKYATLEDIVNAIKSNTRHISYVVNNVLDVSNIDIRKIKIIDSTYDIKRLFEEINLIIKNKVGNDVVYHANIANDIPKFLYGDYIKLKQVIMSILLNSVKNTKKGFIELNINVLVKYDMCRLIISVEDSGKGMDIKTINDILTVDKPISEEEEKKIDLMDVDLNITKKIINLIGGSMTIKSEVHKGTEFIVVIDQKIADKPQKKVYKSGDIEKKVLLIDDELEKLQIEKKILEEYGINVVSTMYGMDAVDRIRTGESYDYIIIDDDMANKSAYATIEELEKLDKFDIPVIIMLEKNKEMIKKHYLEKGFIDYLLKADLENEMERIVSKYLN